MDNPKIPDNEMERLKALHSYHVLDTFAEKDFDDITNIAAELCQAPICLISLVDEDRQWFKSNHGIGVRETPRSVSFCGHAINIPNEAFEVVKASTDQRFEDNPLVISAPFIEYYYGVPLRTPEGYVLGTLCIIDHQERILTKRQKYCLEALAKQVVNLLEIRRKNNKINELLANMFPLSKLREIAEVGTIHPLGYDDVTILFTDFKGFTNFSANFSPREVVKELHYLYSNFDSIVYFNQVEKIKTIGDAYMACAGIDTESDNPARDAIQAAIEIRDFMEDYKKECIHNGKLPLEVRIGLHSGPIVSGVVGIKKYSFDIWGDAVNIAAHMENAGEVGKINVSKTTYEKTKNLFDWEHRGQKKIKSNEMLDMYFAESLKLK